MSIEQKIETELSKAFVEKNDVKQSILLETKYRLKHLRYRTAQYSNIDGRIMLEAMLSEKKSILTEMKDKNSRNSDELYSHVIEVLMLKHLLTEERR